MKKTFEEPIVDCSKIFNEAVMEGLPDMGGGVGSNVFPDDGDF